MIDAAAIDSTNPSPPITASQSHGVSSLSRPSTKTCFGISGNVRPALALSALKLFLMPALVLALAWLFGLPPSTAKVAVVAAALPSGINSYLIAVQFGTGQALASNQMTIATAAAVVTCSFWVTAAERIFG